MRNDCDGRSCGLLSIQLLHVQQYTLEKQKYCQKQAQRPIQSKGSTRAFSHQIHRSVLFVSLVTQIPSSSRPKQESRSHAYTAAYARSKANNVVAQFYVTVHFSPNDERTMTWMTGTQKMTCSWLEFMKFLKVDFQGADNPLGLRPHAPSSSTSTPRRGCNNFM